MVLQKKHVLIISQYFPPDVLGSGTRAFNYAKCLVQKNYKVTVICGHPHVHNAVPKKYRHKLVLREELEGIDVIRVWVPSLLHTSARNRILLHFSYILSSLIPLPSLKPDIILACSPALFGIIPAYIYSKVRGSNVIRVVDDLWPEVIYERGYVKSKIIKRVLDSLARFSYSYPKFVLPLTYEAKNYIEKNYNIEPDKVIVLEHGVDTHIFKYEKKERAEFFVLMYSGAIVESYDFVMILNAAKALKSKKIKFIIRGKGILLKYLEEQKKKLELDNLIIDTNIVSLHELARLLSSSDVLLLPMKNEYNLNLSLPTKILEYQAVGRPIICSSEGAPANYIERTKSGIRIGYEDLPGFINAIEKLENSPELCKLLGENGRKHAENFLDFDKIGTILSKIVSDTLN